MIFTVLRSFYRLRFEQTLLWRCASKICILHSLSWIFVDYLGKLFLLRFIYYWLYYTGQSLWSAYFSSHQVSVPKPPAIIALLPLFRDAAHSPAMVKHGMDIIQQITLWCNPNQIPVLTVDQPLYAIAKRIQWKWPEKYGERRYVVMMGGLHIEMALLKVIGD